MLESEEDIRVVGEATTGEEGIAQAQRLSPDVVLMDIKMPGVDGIAATRQLKEKMPDMKVVMLTMYDSDLVMQAIEAGALGYILKDARREQLLQAIHDAYDGYFPLSPSVTQELVTKFSKLSRAYRDSLLSERQREILRLSAVGLVRKEVADALYVSEATVKKELTDIFNKLGASDQAQAVSEAMKRRLI